MVVIQMVEKDTVVVIQVVKKDEVIVIQVNGSMLQTIYFVIQFFRCRRELHEMLLDAG